MLAIDTRRVYNMTMDNHNLSNNRTYHLSPKAQNLFLCNGGCGLAWVIDCVVNNGEGDGTGRRGLRLGNYPLVGSNPTPTHHEIKQCRPSGCSQVVRREVAPSTLVRFQAPRPNKIKHSCMLQDP